MEVSACDLVQFAKSDSKILSARRLNRKVISSDSLSYPYEPSTTVLLCFDSKFPPKFILIDLVKYNTDRYKQSPKQCFQCFKFGHLQHSCKSKAKCSHCGSQEHNATIFCPNSEKDPVCSNCNQNHRPTDATCPYKIYQIQLHNLAFSKNISLDDARILMKDSNYKFDSTNFPSIQSNISSSNIQSSNSKSSNRVSFSNVVQCSDIKIPTLLRH